MAKKNQVYIQIEVDDKGTTKRVAVNAQKLGIALDKTANASEKNVKGTDKLSKSQKTLDRNMRGTAKMSGNSTKEFSKMQQGMGGLVGAYATLAAQVFAVSAAFQFLQSASDLRNLISGQEAMGAMTGTTYKTMTASIIQATDAQLKYADAAKAAAIGTAAGLTSGQLTNLATVAKNASFALGRDLTDSFNRLVRGVTKAEPELLDELGIILRLETATKKYAEAIGKGVTELNAFERTQAVTNEVLEQGTQKFEKIEALMSKDAATLAKFTKSFDELTNVFKIGLIETITPALTFLANNTLGLVAALALVGTPILKAILPNMDMWIDRNDKLMKIEEKASKKRDKQFRQEKKNLKIAMKSHKELVSQRQQSAQSVLDGKGIKGGKGIDALGQGVSTPGGQKAAQGMIDKANAEIANNRNRTGALKSASKQELNILQASLDEQLKSEKQHAEQQKRIKDSELTNTEKNQRKRKESWGKANKAILTGGRRLAVGMNFAFKAIAIFGMLSLLYEAAVALYRLANPLTDIQKAEAESADQMIAKYKVLHEEMERNSRARKTILAGGSSIVSDGNTVQGADVANLIKDLNALGAAQDKTTKGWKTSEEAAIQAVKNLEGFGTPLKLVREEYEETGKVSRDTAQAAIRLANEIIDLGQAISGLPELMKATNTAFSQLGVDAAKNTNLSKAVDSAQEEMDSLNRVIMESDKQLGEDRKNLDNKLKASEERRAMEHSLEILNIELKGLAGPSRSKKADQIVEETKALRAFMKENETLTQQEIRNRNSRIADEDAINGRREERLEDVRKEHKILAKEESRRIRRVAVQLQTQTRFAKTRMQGITIEGKISNLEEARYKKSIKLEEAQNELIDAQNNKRMAQGKDNQASADETYEAALKRFELAKAENVFELRGIDIQENLLRLEKERLSLSRERINLQDLEFKKSRNLTRAKGLSGGSDMNIQNIRAAERAYLNARIETQKKIKESAIRMETDERERLMKAAGEKYGLQFDIVNAAQGVTPPDYERAHYIRETMDLSGDLLSVLDQVALSTGKATVAESEKLRKLQDQLVILQRMAQVTEAISRKAFDEAVARNRTGGFRGTAKVRFETNYANRNKLDEEGNLLSSTTAGQARLKALEQEAVATYELMEMERKRSELADSIQSNMTDAFMAIIDGSKNAKQAFADMAASILKLIARMIMEALVLKMLQTAMPTLFGAKGGTTPTGGFNSLKSGNTSTTIPLGGKKGGLFGPAYAKGGYGLNKNNFSRGGNARGPNAGYAATLHGNEAVVPLPDNRSIPVDLKGAGQNNNVTVNVSMDSSGNVQQNTQQDGAQAGKLGNMIANAVQQELQFQKRSGGILNPYGVA